MSDGRLGEGVLVEAEPPAGKWMRWSHADLFASKINGADGRVLDLHNVIFPAAGEIVWVEGDTFYVSHFNGSTTAYRGEWLSTPTPTDQTKERRP